MTLILANRAPGVATIAADAQGSLGPSEKFKARKLLDIGREKVYLFAGAGDGNAIYKVASDAYAWWNKTTAEERKEPGLAQLAGYLQRRTADLFGNKRQDYIPDFVVIGAESGDVKIFETNVDAVIERDEAYIGSGGRRAERHVVEDRQRGIETPPRNMALAFLHIYQYSRLVWEQDKDSDTTMQFGIATKDGVVREVFHPRLFRGVYPPEYSDEFMRHIELNAGRQKVEADNFEKWKHRMDRFYFELTRAASHLQRSRAISSRLHIAGQDSQRWEKEMAADERFLQYMLESLIKGGENIHTANKASVNRYGEKAD